MLDYAIRPGAHVLRMSAHVLRSDYPFRSRITRREPVMDLTAAFDFLDSDSEHDKAPIQPPFPARPSSFPNFLRDKTGTPLIRYDYLKWLHIIQRVLSQGRESAEAQTAMAEGSQRIRLRGETRGVICGVQYVNFRKREVRVDRHRTVSKRNSARSISRALFQVCQGPTFSNSTSGR